MKDVFVEIPFAQVEFATETGELTIQQKTKIISDSMDLDIISVDTNRDVGQDDCPTFSITLIYRPDWYERVGPNDLVQITLGRGKRKSPVMYGMVDTIYKSWSFVDLKPTRTITISGRGFNKAFIQFGIGAVQEVNFNFQSVGFFEGQDQGFSKTTPAQLIKTVFEYYFEKGINLEFANGKNLKDYVNAIFLEDPEEEVTLGDTMGYYSYQGGLWDYIKELRNAPFYEVFWEVVNDKPTFIVRPTPFNPENWTELKMTQVDDRDIIDENLGRTDLETYTVYAVKGESIVSNLDNVFGLPIWYEPFYEKYGLRRLEVQSKYMKAGEIPNNEHMVYDEVQMGSGSGGSLAYPVPSKYKITSKFGPRKKVTKQDSGYHKGLDFGAPRGTEIYCAEDGIIKLVTFDKWRGHYVDVQHDNGLVTRYQHCNVRPPLPIGTRVKRGQVIAQVGSTGDSTGPHLHYEVHVNGKAVDPAPYIKGQGSSSGNKGTNSSPYETPIRSVDWNINKNEDFDSENKQWEDSLEQFLNEDTKDNIDMLELFEKNKNLFNNPITDALFDSLSEKELKEILSIKVGLEKDKNEAKDFSTINVSEKTIDLFNWNIKNNMMENGSIKLKGYPYQVGTRLYYKETDMEYYIEKVSHSFVYNETWTTTLEITRGLKLGTRFEKPWNEWTIITAEDLERVTGISQALMNKSSTSVSGTMSGTSATASDTINGLRGKIEQKAIAKTGELYNGKNRMGENYSDCSSFVYKRVMEALGKSWKGTSAPSTITMHKSNLWSEIPMSEVKPWDILVRSGHTEFLGSDGRTFGAHDYGQPAGPGEKFNPKKWAKAYRVNGV